MSEIEGEVEKEVRTESVNGAAANEADLANVADPANEAGQTGTGQDREAGTVENADGRENGEVGLAKDVADQGLRSVLNLRRHLW